MMKISLSVLAVACLFAQAAYADGATQRRRKGPSVLELAFAEQNQDEVDSALADLEEDIAGAQPSTQPVAPEQSEAGPVAPKPSEGGSPEPSAPEPQSPIPEPRAPSPAPIVITNVVEKIVEVERPVVVTNTVERIVEKRVTDSELQDRVDFTEAVNTDLAERNERLEQALAIERERRERLERALPKGRLPKTGRPARITAPNTFYDRKEGVVMFDRRVHVDDESYQLWADKAYVFLQGTNDVRRIVAMGNVAITNEARRAYGAKASYYKDGGMVVLYGGDGILAEVRDESKVDDQTVKGSKIKFWIDSEQVQVIDADISAPVQGGGAEGFKQVIGK